MFVQMPQYVQSLRESWIYRQTYIRYILFAKQIYSVLYSWFTHFCDHILSSLLTYFFSHKQRAPLPSLLPPPPTSQAQQLQKRSRLHCLPFTGRLHKHFKITLIITIIKWVQIGIQCILYISYMNKYNELSSCCINTSKLNHSHHDHHHQKISQNEYKQIQRVQSQTNE